MNIVQALDAALPELPERIAQRAYPKLDPRVIAKQHVERGKAVVLAKLPGSENFLNLSPEQWELLKLFDGRRSYSEVAEAFVAAHGVSLSEDDAREFSGFLIKNAEIFYKTPLEKNLALGRKPKRGNIRRSRFKLADVANIEIHQWPKADSYLTRIYPYLKWIYTPWCTWLTLALFAVMAWMWMAKFGEIWHDSFAFYDFTSKTLQDLVEFWFLFGAMACIHETAHGLTCKHFGANVEKMGFMLMYFAPTFYCDVTQIWIHGGKFERLCTVIAGIWSDFIVCAFATFLWWSTATGMLLHDYAYKVMMVTGIGVTIANLNPLIKLDGYYMFAELTGEVDLKERSTLYLSGWIRKHIFRMPAELEYVIRSRRPFYIGYAVLSGLYSYALIAVFVFFSYHVFRAYTPEWAFVPAAAIAFFAFRSRFGTLRRFLQMFYLDKRDRLRAWVKVHPARIVLLAAAALLLIFAPIWPDFVGGTCTIGPVQRAMVRAQVPGQVTAVFVREGDRVLPGKVLLTLRNLDLESRASRTRADLQVASAKVVQAELRYSGYGAALRERERLSVLSRTLDEQIKLLPVSSPIAGTVVTPRIEDLDHAYLAAGTPIAEVEDFSAMVARVYVPEFAVRDLTLGAQARVLVPNRITPLSGTLIAVSPENEGIASDLLPAQQLSGLHAPRFYLATVRINDRGHLRPEMSGVAKIFVARRSLAALSGRFVREVVERRLW